MFKKTILLSVCLSLAFSTVSFADGYHWQNQNGKWYYQNNNGEIKKGRFFDDSGNLYDTGNNIDGSIIISNSNDLGEFFDHTGSMVNPNMIYQEHFNELAKKYEAGETLSFQTKEEYSNFINFYEAQYRLIDNHAIYWSLYYPDTGIYTTSLKSDYFYDRDQIKNQIFNKFGYLTSTDDYDKILEACRKVCSLDCDNNYTNVKMDVALNNNKGVCWHFAKSAAVLLRDAGVYTEIVTGTMKGSETWHMWLRCKVDGKWIYVDPTFCKNSFDLYSNIDYQTYLDTYNMKTLINLD